MSSLLFNFHGCKLESFKEKFKMLGYIVSLSEMNLGFDLGNIQSFFICWRAKSQLLREGGRR
jgi:hypothetical protein